MADLNKPLTKEELKKLQKKQGKSSPYNEGKSPFKKALNPFPDIFHSSTSFNGDVNDNA
tara:strand:+ start:956 stop:1132 length:177 start_codon:yes stop_codon:yes gene_type:complete